MHIARTFLRRLDVVALAFALAPGAVLAQQAPEPPAQLSLEAAIDIAERNNPDFRAQANDVDIARWDVREAWGALLPGASASLGFQYQAEGDVNFGAVTVGRTPETYYSDYSYGLSYFLDAESVARVSVQRSRLRAANATVRAALIGLATQVRGQYVLALGAQDAVGVSRREVELAQENVELARARVEIGAAPELELTQAEVSLGRAQVNLLTAENNALNQKLALLRLMGTRLDTSVELTSTFEVFEPDWSVEELVGIAMEGHPQLAALRANRDAGQSAVRAAKFTYLPSLSMQAGWSGFAREISDRGAVLGQLEAEAANCAALNEIITRLNPPLPAQDCTITPEMEAQALAQNDAFPFEFSDQPFSASARISLPIFTGFAREARIQEAQTVADDTRYALRAQELQLTSDVITAHRNLETAYRAVQIEARNQELAERQLELARERYRLGALSYIDLAESTTLKAQADRAYLGSVYAFHQALAALEAAVGRPLTTPISESE